MQHETGSSSPRRAALVRRMTFSYDGEKITLVSEQKVQMKVPSSHALDKIESAQGFSVVVRDKDGTPLYRRVMQSPIRHDVEVFSPNEPIQRIPSERPKGTFVVLVPDLPNAEHLEFVGQPLRPKAHLEPSRRLASFVLKRDRAMEPV